MKSNLIKLRKKYNLKQDDLAVYLEMSQKGYSNIENDIIININKDILVKLALLYNISNDYLLGITNKPIKLQIDSKKEILKELGIDEKTFNYLRKEIIKVDNQLKNADNILNKIS